MKEEERDEYNEHYLIFTAIKEKNPEKAENLMTEHEKKVVDFLEKRVFMYMS